MSKLSVSADLILQQEFSMCIDTQGVLEGRTPMGVLGARVYEGGGDLRFDAVRNSETYSLSRDSRFLTINKADAILQDIPDVKHIYFLGANSNEAFAFAKASSELKSCSIIDIAENEARLVSSFVRNNTQGLDVSYHTMDFSKDLLPQTDGSRLIVYPSSNVGNTKGYYGQAPKDNPFLHAQLSKLKQRTDYLTIIYDTERDPSKLQTIYGGPEVLDFVRGVFHTVKSRLGLDGFDPDALKFDSFWHEESSAELHSVVVQDDMAFQLGRRNVSLFEGQRMFPVHSYKFTPEQVEEILSITDWKLISTQEDCSSVVAQTYGVSLE